MKINKARDWWGMLGKEQRIEIYQLNNPEATDQDWTDWWYRMNDLEREEVYNENIQEVKVNV